LTYNGLHGIISCKTKLFISWQCSQNPVIFPYSEPSKSISYLHIPSLRQATSLKHHPPIPQPCFHIDLLSQCFPIKMKHGFIASLIFLAFISLQTILWKEHKLGTYSLYYSRQSFTIPSLLRQMFSLRISCQVC
jgi:hypothetical protein